MAGLRFGMQTPAVRPWSEMVDRWRRFEALGFESLWLPDHLVPPFNPAGPLLEAWTLLAALATQTERARIGVLVSCNTFRHPPLLAKQAVTLDHLSGGRLELGLGAGWFVPEHEMFGIPFPEPVELVDRFREAVELIDLMLRQDMTSYDGRYYQLREAPCRPAPLQRPRPPLTLGAHGPKMLRIAAAHADRWSSLGTVAEIAARNGVLDEECAAIGRDPGAILRSLLNVPVQMPNETPWSSRDAFQDFVGRYRAAGIEEFLFQPPPDDGLSVLERIAVEVLPSLRGG